MKRLRTRGFTLVELTVSIALLSLLGLALVGALRSFSGIESRVDDLLRRDANLRASLPFLRSLLSAVAPVGTRSGDTPARIEFAGFESQLTWVGILPARHGAGGLYRFRLSQRAKADASTSELLLQFAPYLTGGAPLNESSMVESRILIDGVMAASFRYQGDEARADWQRSWQEGERLPHRIGLKVSTANDDWPDLVVTVIPATGPGRISTPGGIVEMSTINSQALAP